MSKANGMVAPSVEKPRPRSVDVASRGISTATQFAGLMSCLMSEVLSGDVSPAVCNAAVNAGGKLLKVVELQERYGKPNGENGTKEFQLCAPTAGTCSQAVDRRSLRIAELENELAMLRD